MSIQFQQPWQSGGYLLFRLRLIAICNYLNNPKNVFQRIYRFFSGAQAAGNAAAAVASGQPETAIEHIDYRNKLSEIRTIYHMEVN